MDQQLQELAEAAVRHAADRGVQYCDARAEQRASESALVEDGRVEHVRAARDSGIGIRLLHGGAWGFCSVAAPASFGQVSERLDAAISDTMHYSRGKRDPVRLAPAPARRAREAFPVASRPDMHELVRIALDCDGMIREGRDVSKSSVSPAYSVSSKYFASSEGGSVLQEFTDVVVHMAATARGHGVAQSVDATEGGRGGTERVTGGDAVYESARRVAGKASGLLRARRAEEGKATVVMDPDFVALLTHEILGHPSEADRVLGREMAWAGGAWWGGMLGQRIGSDSLSVFDDPTLEGSLGWYRFDDEGVDAERTVLVEDGILKGHMQSRETAGIFGAAPTGNMRASGYGAMPLIRMACTCIGAGDYGPDEIVRGVSDGYLISGMKVPSIDMNRHNWSISCQYAQRIMGGEPGDLHRDVIVTGTARDFFDSIDACGDDFAVRPITNCGKGDPMQQMAMGNGGPTVRGRATVRSLG